MKFLEPIEELEPDIVDVLEADTVEGRLADILESDQSLIVESRDGDQDRVSRSDRAKIISALRSAANLKGHRDAP